MYICKYNLEKECKGNYKDCVYCILSQIKSEIEAEKREPDCFDDMFEYYAGINDAIYVVNRKIKELKGLNKGDKTK